MSCDCFESGVKSGLQSFEGSPVCDEKIFSDRKECGDGDYPYVVFRTSVTPGLRTSSGLQKIHNIQVSGYFADKSQAKSWRSLFEIWLYGSGGVMLGECGSLCVTSPPSVTLSPAAKDKWQVTGTFAGVFHSSGES